LNAISIGYHDVVDALVDRGRTRGEWHYALARSDFRAHLNGIRERRGAAVSTIERERPLWSGRPVFLTFDDGAVGAHTCVADELEKVGWRGHFFITSDWVGRRGFLSADQICELRRRGHVIGSHTRSHPERMSALTWNRLLEEWSESVDVLSNILGERVTVASVANGYFSRKVAQSAAAAGLEVLFTSEPVTAVSRVDGCLVLGRFVITNGSSPEESGRFAAGDVRLRLRTAVSWQLKKTVKRVAGPAYLSARRLLLSYGKPREHAIHTSTSN
jgi:peptidoglycan/xylan/chitin deacetylase (PgdA/CDA1 family)